MLTACCHAGLVDEAWKYFNSMNQDFGIAPGLEHYAAVVDPEMQSCKHIYPLDKGTHGHGFLLKLIFIFRLRVLTCTTVEPRHYFQAKISGDL